MTGAFDSGCQLTLMACAGSGNSSGNDFASFREESSQTGDIFVINVGNFINAERADSFTAAAVAVHWSFRTFRSFHNKSSFTDFQFLRIQYSTAQKGRSSSSTTVKSSASPEAKATGAGLSIGGANSFLSVLPPIAEPLSLDFGTNSTLSACTSTDFRF